jgi:hypothetical protein
MQPPQHDSGVLESVFLEDKAGSTLLTSTAPRQVFSGDVDEGDLAYQSSFQSELTQMIPTPSKANSGPIKSSLRKSTSDRWSNTTKPPTPRRVKFDKESCLFASLRESTLLHVFTLLDTQSLLQAAQVSQRWLHVSKQAWQSIDATDFCQHVFDSYNATDTESNRKDAAIRTSDTLTRFLNQKKPSILRIRNIGAKLSANHFLPRLARVHELVLEGFADLTDAHAHVLLVAQHAVQRAPNPLIVLRLINCPLLTNATIKRIALHCEHLQELDLTGCKGITSVESLKFKESSPQTRLRGNNHTTPLRSVFTASEEVSETEPKQCLQHTKVSSSANNKLGNLFAAPVHATNPLGDLFAPLTKRAPSSKPLGSLFVSPIKVNTSAKPIAAIAATTTRFRGAVVAPAPDSPSHLEVKNSSHSNQFASPIRQENARSLPPFKVRSHTPPLLVQRDSLSSLFAPPGSFPPRHFLVENPGTLTHVALPPSIGPQSLVASLQGRRIALTSLTLTGDEWDTWHVCRLLEILDLSALQELNIACVEPSSMLTRLATDASFEVLERLFVQNHTALNIDGIQAPKLQQVNEQQFKRVCRD